MRGLSVRFQKLCNVCFQVIFNLIVSKQGATTGFEHVVITKVQFANHQMKGRHLSNSCAQAVAYQLRSTVSLGIVWMSFIVMR